MRSSNKSPGGEAGRERDDGLVAIGYVSRAHGIRGELVFVPQGDDPSLADGLVYLRPRQGGAARAYRVCGRRGHHGNLLLSFEGVGDRNAAEQLASHTLLIERARLPLPDEDEVYLVDLPGLAVEVRDASGGWRPLGRIVRAEAPAGQLLWTIRTPEGRDVLFPAVDAFIVSLDLEAGLARIEPPPGLLELYLS